MTRTSAGCSSFDLHHHLQQQFLSSREPFPVLTCSHWCGAACTALNSTLCYSLATYCTHKRYGFQRTADCIAKCTQAPASFSLQLKLHTITGVCSGRHRSPLCFSPPPSLYLSFKKGEELSPQCCSRTPSSSAAEGTLKLSVRED